MSVNLNSELDFPVKYVKKTEIMNGQQTAAK